MEKDEFRLRTMPKAFSSESSRHLDPFEHVDGIASDGSSPWVGEAAEMYGDYETAQELGYVTRGYGCESHRF